MRKSLLLQKIGAKLLLVVQIQYYWQVFTEPENLVCHHSVYCEHVTNRAMKYKVT